LLSEFYAITSLLSIVQHRAAVLAIANALMIHRTLDAVMIHKIIALAPERARRADWARTCANVIV
jgi:hypothetical protein